MKQVTLFGEKVLSQREKEIEEHNKRCEQARFKRREKGEHETWSNASFPCPVALKLPQEERHNHIMNCEECKRLERELDEKYGIKNHVYS